HWQEALGRMPETMAEKIKTNFRLGFLRLREMGVDWAICIDADELVHASRGVRRYLSQVREGVDTIRVPPLEAVHSDRDRTDLAFSPVLFKSLPWMQRKRLLTPLLAREIDGVTDRRFFGHQAGKGF